jgi:DNA-binding CsgD family transcriptional regulator
VDGRGLFVFGAGAAGGFLVARAVLERRMGPADQLTDRQRQILRAVGAGKTTKAIAAEIGISQASVNTHIRRARTTLRVPTRAAAAAAVAGQTVATPARPRRSATRSWRSAAGSTQNSSVPV